MAQGRVSFVFLLWMSVRWFLTGVCEVYAYVPRDNNICSDKGLLCNDEFGISIDRGSFTFASGRYAIYIRDPVAPSDPQSKVEPSHHAGQVKQSDQHC